MNCLQARQQFVAFWRKSLAAEARRDFLAHLTECGACDQAFRAFALTAPVLYGEARRHAPPATVIPAPLRARSRGTGPLDASGSRRVLAMALVAALAAAVVAVYFSLPPRVTFEDALGEDATGVARTTYSPPENLFWPVGAEPVASPPDADQHAGARGKHQHLAS